MGCRWWAVSQAAILAILLVCPRRRLSSSPVSQAKLAAATGSLHAAANAPSREKAAELPRLDANVPTAAEAAHGSIPIAANAPSQDLAAEAAHGLTPAAANAPSQDKEAELRWRTQYERQQSGFDVQNVSLGSWTPSPGCPTPLLWMYIYGEYRTFAKTQDYYADFLERSAGPCHIVIVVMPDLVCTPKGPLCLFKGSGKLKWTDFTASVDATAHLLSKASVDVFHGRMAFTVVSQRNAVRGKARNFRMNDERLHLYWRALDSFGKVVAKARGFSPRRDSLVVRARADMIFPVHFLLEGPMTYFARGEWGAHLAFSQFYSIRPNGAQGDFFFATSYAGYESDIARGPFQWNGWGEAARAYKDGQRCVKLSGSGVVSCPQVQMESFLYPTSSAVRTLPVATTHAPTKPFNLTEGVHLYCPVPPQPAHLGKWEVMAFGFRGKRLHRLVKPVDLVKNGEPVRISQLYHDAGCIYAWPFDKDACDGHCPRHGR